MDEKIVALLFPKEVEKVKNKICPLCNESINENEFRDFLSKEEYKISGICQECQDSIFDKT